MTGAFRLQSKLVLLLCLASCSKAEKTVPPAHTLAIKSVRDLGPLETTPAVKGRDGGYSGTFGNRSIWLYGDTVLSLEGEDKSSWRHNTWSWTEDRDASDGLTSFREPVDALGAPKEFFPQSEDEAAFNNAHRGEACEAPCGARRVLWPMDIIEDKARKRVLIFYEKIYGEPGEWNFHALGFGVAVWETFDELPLRPSVRSESGEPTLLFEGEEDNFGEAALIVGDTLYAYGCSQRGGIWKECLLGQVGLAHVTDRSAWRFWNGADWVENLLEAKSVFRGASQMTVHWNDYLGQYLAIYAAEPTDVIQLRTAPAPEGPWSYAVDAFKALPAKEGWVYCGLGHKEYAREGGKIEYVTYFRSTEPWRGEIRLVELTFQ